MASLKELVVQGWKSDNGFRAGYLTKLEEAMKAAFPETDLKGSPHINSKICAWKKNYYSLSQMLSRSGIGFNTNGDYLIDCSNEMWEQIVKCDPNARLMRYKPWPMLEDWKEVFGKDRATGEQAEDLMDAVNEMHRREHVVLNTPESDYHVNLDDILDHETVDESVGQSSKETPTAGVVGRKRKQRDDMSGLCEVLREINRTTDRRLENLANRIGYDFDMGKARQEVFDQLGCISSFTMEDKFDVCELLADKIERLEIFRGLPAEAKEAYARRFLEGRFK
ncbi:uncharacterized protein LOC131020551 [Salvia miltiorrhiza]|uniref:uncharacterized protein LOC130990574 n=1 Tax=Salvia miltiorrhiza TaxID=226208 RepID=UPI0025AD90DB|nr:uncharacterized protein LOC130990574 [Salvia miltiorrhiza]XP_057805431.1 uncharacterized protein LOC131020551 [Salvia miltiorrhiza]